MVNDVLNTYADTPRARRQTERIPNHSDNYVLEGIGLAVDDEDELTVGSGELTLTDGEIVYHVAVQTRTGEDTITVPADSQLGVYYDIAPNDIVVQASAPDEPMLKLGTVDTAAGTTTLTNRKPNQTVRSLKAERIADAYHYAAAYSGSNPDERLSNAVNAAEDGDYVFLEAENYTQDLTVDNGLTLSGTGVDEQNSSRITGDTTWTMNGNVLIEKISMPSGGVEIVLNAAESHFYDSYGFADSQITVNAGQCNIQGLRWCTVVFANGTSGGIVDSCVRTAVTDNGSNTVGDIS